MNKKDIGEIKRRFNLEHNNITCIRGCYVNNQGEVISSFTRYLQGMGQEEAENIWRFSSAPCPAPRART